VLRIHISSEEDPFFLHTLEVSEEEFQALKAEQGILVDFGHFSGKIITLLEKCLASQLPDAPRWVRHGASTHRGLLRRRQGRRMAASVLGTAGTVRFAQSSAYPTPEAWWCNQSLRAARWLRRSAQAARPI
jgi:hypothetical protein